MKKTTNIKEYDVGLNAIMDIFCEFVKMSTECAICLFVVNLISTR